MQSSPAFCSTQYALLTDEANTWSVYWAKYLESNPANPDQSQLCHLLENAVRASEKFHTDHCPTCLGGTKNDAEGTLRFGDGKNET